MTTNRLNPYQAPDAVGVGRGHARFRLRRWFAATLYLALLVDFVVVWTFGLQPFVLSIPTFMLTLIASLLTRHDAAIRVHDAGIEYRDLVQFVDVSWDRVVGVTHKPGRTSIATDSPLAQITVSRKHEDYQAIVGKLAEVQSAFHFEIADRRSEGS